MIRGARALVGVLTVAAAAAPIAPARAQQVDVRPGEDAFTTGVVLGGSGDGGDETRRGAARCPGCAWHLAPACPGNGYLGRSADGVALWRDDGLCAGAISSCPEVDQVRHAVWVRHPGEVDYERVAGGGVCLGPRVPVVARAVLAADVASFLARLPLPAPSLRAQPPTASVVGLPAVLSGGAAEPVLGAYSPFGLSVGVRARPVAWSYDFGDGAPPELRTAPARAYPDGDVARAYQRPGTHTARMAVTWRGEYRVAGDSGDDDWQPVTGEVTRTAALTITVREARTVLLDSR